MKSLYVIVICLVTTCVMFAISPKNEKWRNLTYEELENKLLTVSTDKDQCDILNLLADKWSYRDYNKAFTRAQSAFKKSEEIGYSVGKIDSLNNQGLIYTRKGDMKDAKKCFDQVINDEKSRNYKIGLINAHIGYVRYYQVKGMFGNALMSLMSAEKLLKYSPDATSLGNYYHGFGVVYFYDKHTFSESRKYFEKSLEERNKIKDIDAIALTYYSLGEVNQHLEKWDDAEKYFQMAEDIFKKNNLPVNKYIKANVAQGRGDILFKRYKEKGSNSDISNPLKLYHESKDLFESLGDIYQQAAINRNIGLCLLDFGRDQEAISYLVEAVKLAKITDNAYTIAIAANKLVECYKGLQKKENSKRYKAEIKKYKTLAYQAANKLETNSLINFHIRNQKKTEIKIESEQRKFFETVIYILSIVAVLLSVSIGFLNHFRMKSNRTARELEIANRELETSNNELEQAYKELEKKKEKAEKTLQDIKLLNQIGKEITSSLEIKEIIDKTYQQVNRIMEAEAFVIYRHNTATDALDITSKEHGEDLPPHSFGLRDEDRMVVQSYLKQKNIRTKNYPREYHRFSLRKPDPKEGDSFISHIFIPLTFNPQKGKTQRIGVISVQSSIEAAYDEYHEMMLSNIATFTAIALTNAETLKKEKEISQIKDDFMYNLSHEYKTPMTIIRQAAQYLKRFLSKLDASKINDKLDMVDRNIDRMNNLINKLLESGKPFNPERHNLVKICREHIEIMRRNDNGKMHTINWSPNNFVVEVTVDKSMIEIILDNLIQNSIKYSKNGSVIDVKLSCIGKKTILSVSDNGCGIPQDIIKLKDKRFHRGSNAFGTPGTGLGLSIVERFVKLQRGFINYYSQKNVGTTVKITFPLARGDNKA